MVAAAVRTIFAQPDAGSVRRQLDVIAGMLGRQFPKVETMLRDAACDSPHSPTSRPSTGRRSGPPTASNASTGRSNDAPTSSASSPTPPRCSASPVPCSAEIHDEWQVSDRRYLSEASMAKLANPQPPTSQPRVERGGAPTQTRVIVQPAPATAKTHTRTVTPLGGTRPLRSASQPINTPGFPALQRQQLIALSRGIVRALLRRLTCSDVGGPGFRGLQRCGGPCQARDRYAAGTQEIRSVRGWTARCCRPTGHLTLAPRRFRGCLIARELSAAWRGRQSSRPLVCVRFRTGARSSRGARRRRPLRQRAMTRRCPATGDRRCRGSSSPMRGAVAPAPS